MSLPNTIYKRAEKEAINSQLPGRQDGPADAYRHILAAAEAVRQGYSEWLVRSWGSIREWHDPPDRAAMDRHNNDVGIEIGKNSETWNDVLNKARRAIENGSENFDDHHATWRPEAEWDGNPKNVTTPDPDDRWPTEQTNWPPRWPNGDSPDNPNWWRHHAGDLIKAQALDWIKDFRNWLDSYPDFSDAEQEISPIVFDLDGDGVKTLSLAATRHFDLDNSGFAEQTAWVDSGDGLLVLDLDGNGRIERGAELFGNHTALGDGTNAADGYAALAQYDDNGDGRIDAEDAIWQQLQVWRDSDSDARSRAEELHALADFDITAISLAATEVDETDAAGNRVTHRGEVRRADDSVSAAADVWFQVNTAVSVYQGEREVSAEIEALPNVQAFGNVPDLHIAMQRDAELKRQVEAYLAADEDSRGALLDARKRAARENPMEDALAIIGAPPLLKSKPLFALTK